jgi:hypothetical protein
MWAAGTLVTATACSESSAVLTEPRNASVASHSITSASSGFVLTSNTVKYADNGAKAWHGKSSKGQDVWSRALIDQNGVVTLEVATAEFESGHPTVGQLDKVQVKMVAPSGAKSVQNFNYVPLNNGYLALSLGHTARNTVALVQVNVDDATGKRTDVVIADDTVKFRPDLRVFLIVVAPHVRVSAPFDVGATVSEIKGDVGARADCVLKLDGSEVDRISGMWVDRSGSVSCAFHAPGFVTLGTHTVTISVDREGPTDFDFSTNSATASVEAVIDHIQLGYDVTISQTVGHSKSEHATYYTGTNGSRSEAHLNTESDHNEQMANFSAWADQPVRPRLGTLVVDGSAATSATLTFSELSDGLPVDAVTYPSIPLHLNYGTVDGDGGGCFLSGQQADGFVLSVCSGWSADGTGQSYIQYSRFANRVVYLSTNYVVAYAFATGTTTVGPTYITSPPPALSGRSFMPYGNTATFNFHLEYGNFTLDAHPTISLVAAIYNADVPLLCSLPYTTNGGSEKVCDQFFDNGIKTEGFVSTGDQNLAR